MCITAFVYGAGPFGEACQRQVRRRCLLHRGTTRDGRAHRSPKSELSANMTLKLLCSFWRMPSQWLIFSLVISSLPGELVHVLFVCRLIFFFIRGVETDASPARCSGGACAQESGWSKTPRLGLACLGRCVGCFAHRSLRDGCPGHRARLAPAPRDNPLFQRRAWCRFSRSAPAALALLASLYRLLWFVNFAQHACLFDNLCASSAPCTLNTLLPAVHATCHGAQYEKEGKTAALSTM